MHVSPLYEAARFLSLTFLRSGFKFSQLEMSMSAYFTSFRQTNMICDIRGRFVHPPIIVPFQPV